MKRLRLALFGIVTLGGIGCDHATKQAATLWLQPGASVSLLGDALRFELVHNPGAFMSLGAQWSPIARDLLFLGLAPLALVVLSVWFLRTHELRVPQILALALVASGGFANWIDRLLNAGAVTDFVSLGHGSVRTGIFNVADVLIVLGIVALVWTLRDSGSDRAPA